MGQRGPKPTPTKVLQLRGSWLAKTRKDEPQPEAVMPDKPDWLKEDAARAWEYVTRHLHVLRLIGHIDQHALARYCRLWQRWRQMEDQIDVEGTVKVFKDDAGHIIAEEVSRAVGIAGNLAAALLKLEHEFGMTVSGRAALGVALAQQKKHEHTTHARQPKAKARLFRLGSSPGAHSGL